MTKINECHEPLVDIASVCPEAILHLDPLRADKEQSLFARKSVADMLAKARKLLPGNTTFVINDAWRPLSAQKMYFDYYTRKFKNRHTKWTRSQIYNEAAKYAIPPDQPLRAGHMTGAAIDLKLWRNGRTLPMQSRRLAFEKRANTDSPQLQEFINRNRALLKSVMEEVGFVNYPKEYWHYSYGDIMWAELTNHKEAIYGPREVL